MTKLSETNHAVFLYFFKFNKHCYVPAMCCLYTTFRAFPLSLKVNNTFKKKKILNPQHLKRRPSLLGMGWLQM